jgi:hypothetical protein
VTAVGGEAIDFATGDALRACRLVVNGVVIDRDARSVRIMPQASVPVPTREVVDAAAIDVALQLADVRSPAAGAWLMSQLQTAAWPVQSACAWALGRRGDAAAVSALLATLACETPEAITPDPLLVDIDWPGFMVGLGDPLQLPSGEHAADPHVSKRWRVKVEVIEALGLLRDRGAVPALAQILQEACDAYPVLAATARALGRIGDPAALPALEVGCAYYEACTHLAARVAYGQLTGRTWKQARKNYSQVGA